MGANGGGEGASRWVPAAKRSAACVWLFFYAGAAAPSYFRVHFILQIVSVYIQSRKGASATLTADWNVESKFKSLGFRLHPFGSARRVYVSTYLRIYRVIKNAALYLSVGPKLFVTLYAPLNGDWLVSQWLGARADGYVGVVRVPAASWYGLDTWAYHYHRCGSFVHGFRYNLSIST